MGLILLRYGEIALKGQNRTYFLRKLRRNVRSCLKANSIEGQVWQEGQRIYLETDLVESAVEAVRKVFGLVSLSPVSAVSANLDDIVKEGEPSRRPQAPEWICPGMPRWTSASKYTRNGP